MLQLRYTRLVEGVHWVNLEAHHVSADISPKASVTVFIKDYAQVVAELRRCADEIEAANAVKANEVKP